MVTRVSKSTRESGAVESIAPVRIEGDTPTTQEPTQQLRVSKTERESGAIESIQPIRISPDVPTTQQPTQTLRDSKAESFRGRDPDPIRSVGEVAGTALGLVSPSRVTSKITAPRPQIDPSIPRATSKSLTDIIAQEQKASKLKKQQQKKQKQKQRPTQRLVQDPLTGIFSIVTDFGKGVVSGATDVAEDVSSFGQGVVAGVQDVFTPKAEAVRPPRPPGSDVTLAGEPGKGLQKGVPALGLSTDTDTTVKEIRPSADQFPSDSLQAAGVVVKPGVPSLVSGLSVIPQAQKGIEGIFSSVEDVFGQVRQGVGKAVVDTRKTIQSVIPFQESSQEDDTFKLEGFKRTDEGIQLFGGGASQARAEALDLDRRDIETTIIPPDPQAEPIVIPGGEIIEIIPGTGKITGEETFFDPKTGREVTVTTREGDTIVRSGETIIIPGGSAGGFSSVDKGLPGGPFGTGVQVIGGEDIAPLPSDVSNPLGSFFTGAAQSLENEAIGIQNIGTIATQGLEAEQREFNVTGSGLFFDTLFEAGSSFAGDLGGAIFDLGRQVAGKEKVQIGQSVTTFGIPGIDKTPPVITQQARKENTTELLQQGFQRISRTAVADPFFLAGDLAVQIPLLVVAPLKAASVAIKGIGTAAKISGKVGSKIATGTGKAISKIPGSKKISDKILLSKIARKDKPTLLSASGEKVTTLAPKTPFSSTFADEFGLGEARALQQSGIEDVSTLTAKQKKNLVKSQRLAFEKKVKELQAGKRPIGETTIDETTGLAVSRSGAGEGTLLPKLSKADAEKLAAEQFAQAGKTDFIPLRLKEDLAPKGEGVFGRLPKDPGDPSSTGFGSPPPLKGSSRAVADIEFRDLLKIETKIAKGDALTLRELSELDRLKLAQKSKVASALEKGTGEGTIGGIRKVQGVGLFDDVIGPPQGTGGLTRIERLGDVPSGAGRPIGSTFDNTLFDLGTGVSKGGDDLGGFGGLGRGGDDFGGAGKGGAGTAGKGGAKSAEEIAAINKLADEQKLPPKKVEKAIDDAFEEAVEEAGEEVGSRGTVQLTKSDFIPTALEKLSRKLKAAKQNVFELEKASVKLKKSKAKNKIPDLPNQKTQKRLSELIKLEKAKVKPKPKATAATKAKDADIATQKALRKLINEEKAKIPRSGVKPGISSKLDNLFSGPKKPKGKAIDELIETPPRRKPGVGTGLGIVGVGVGVGLGLGGLGSQEAVAQDTIFKTDDVVIQKGPTRTTTQNIFDVGQGTKQGGITDVITPTVIRGQDEKITQTQREEQIFGSTFFSPPTQRTTTKQRETSFLDQIFRPSEVTTTRTITEQGFGRFPGFGGARQPIEGKEKSQRRFFRVFDVAKTPFGKIDVGLGAQRQSSQAIFEFTEPGTKKRSKNLSDQFFDDDGSNPFG